jgi:hypothetical protein
VRTLVFLLVPTLAFADATTPTDEILRAVPRPFPSLEAICAHLSTPTYDPNYPIDGDRIPGPLCQPHRLGKRLAAFELRGRDPSEFIESPRVPVGKELRVAVYRNGSWWLLPDQIGGLESEKNRRLDFSKVEREVILKYARFR